MQYEITETERLKLRKITPLDLNYMFEHLSPDQIKKELGIVSHEDFVKEENKYKNGYTMYNRSMLLFQIYSKENNQLIGGCGFHNWMAEHNRAELGYHLLNEEDKRKGYMKETLEFVLDYGFNSLNINRIEACTNPENKASIKLLEKFKFKEEGLLREHYVKDEIIHDSLIFSLLKFEYNHL
ncbi:MAG: GNAT family protein [bacterium]|nr:GNAT family protein [bacterium]